jgi:hypothetical protein
MKNKTWANDSNIPNCSSLGMSPARPEERTDVAAKSDVSCAKTKYNVETWKTKMIKEYKMHGIGLV